MIKVSKEYFDYVDAKCAHSIWSPGGQHGDGDLK